MEFITKLVRFILSNTQTVVIINHGKVEASMSFKPNVIPIDS